MCIRDRAKLATKAADFTGKLFKPRSEGPLDEALNRAGSAGSAVSCTLEGHPLPLLPLTLALEARAAFSAD